jgi:transposase InsO family protein
MTYLPTWTGFSTWLLTRKPQSVIHHSDQGSQYSSIAFGKRCQEMGVRPSMGTVGDTYHPFTLKRNSKLRKKHHQHPLGKGYPPLFDPHQNLRSRTQMCP